jgi:uncharacterized damage-inducible protein DinB
MESVPNLVQELKEEYLITKKFLEVFPEGKNDYSPHEKSMKMMQLASHIAEVFGWADFILKTEKLDFAAGDYVPSNHENKEELQNKFEEDYQKSLQTLENTKEEEMTGGWKMTMGDHIIADYTKYSAIRHALNQITHHRAQLGVYYRLNNIPLPGSYGPSADENF